ncbi:VOC family protein [Abyssalbus ytuae]|uniref:VOC family protein n=1 Tax=Abyssalbus ytuae TaxID=2926907 RepID=A0A9E6ZLF3_9FLAO|nr:VOC family protein [Abyssalbus ytuae]UOB16430.1 VOC family protein [Abyssalbus ytuae]
MKKVILILCFIISCNYCISQPNFNFKEDHTAILVKDVNTSAKFYGEILGLKEIYNAGLGEKFRWFEFTNKVQIHLIESTDDFTPHKGIHLAINTNKLAELIEYLRQKNIPFENWQGEGNTTNTRPDEVKQIYIRDPDGYWIEINDNNLKKNILLNSQ